MLKHVFWASVGLIALTGPVLASPVLEGTYVLTENYKCPDSESQPWIGKLIFDNATHMLKDKNCQYSGVPYHYQCSENISAYSNNGRTLTIELQKFNAVYGTAGGVAKYVTLLGVTKKGQCVINATLVATDDN